MTRFILFFTLLCAALYSNAQDWKLKEIGIGLILQDANYDKVLNVVQKGTIWKMDELYANGAFSGRPDSKILAAWIQGPHTDGFKNANGIPVWMYKYKITYPDGSNFSAGPHGFYSPGFAIVPLDYGKKGPNKYKIEFYIEHRDTKELRQVGSIEFTAIYNN